MEWIKQEYQKKYFSINDNISCPTCELDFKFSSLFNHLQKFKDKRPIEYLNDSLLQIYKEKNSDLISCPFDGCKYFDFLEKLPKCSSTKVNCKKCKKEWVIFNE